MFKMQFRLLMNEFWNLKNEINKKAPYSGAQILKYELTFID